MFEFHENARTAFDAKARDVLARVRDFAQDGAPRNEFKSQRHISATLTNQDIVGESMMWATDEFGKAVAVTFSDGEATRQIADEAYTDLHGLIDAIGKIAWVRSSVGNSFLERTIIQWCRAQRQAVEPESLCGFIATECRKHVRKYVAWVPIANFEVSQPFQFSESVRIDTISKEILDEREAKMLAGERSEPQAIKNRMDRLRNDIQGLAAVVISLEAEKDYAFESAIEIAAIAVGLLRFFSFAALTSRAVSSCEVFGSEHVPQAMALLFSGGGGLNITQRILHPSYYWQLTAEQLAYMRAHQLAQLGALIDDVGINDYQTVVRSSILAFSKGTTVHDINDRLVYTLSALEGLLLRDGSEPIQQNLGERMAFLIRTNPAQRRDVASNVRRVYGMRSSYVHHRTSTIEHEAIDTFISNSRQALAAAVTRLSQFTTKLQFIEQIDQIKFRG